MGQGDDNFGGLGSNVKTEAMLTLGICNALGLVRLCLTITVLPPFQVLNGAAAVMFECRVRVLKTSCLYASNGCETAAKVGGASWR